MINKLPSYISSLKLLAPQSLGPYSWQECQASYVASEFKIADLKLHDFSYPERFESFHSHKQAEFLASRLALKKIYEHFKCTVTVPSTSSQVPTWPAGHLGSITHTKDYAVVAMAQTSGQKLRGLGIDCERLERTAQIEKTWSKISTLADRQYLEQNQLNDPHWKLLIFCAKEALYKAAYPLVQTYFGFDQANVVSIKQETQEILLASDFLTSKGIQNLQGSFELEKDLIKAVVVIGD